MDFDGRNVVVTGGTGALGAAVVGRLLDAGAVCHVPCYDKSELADFPHEGHERVRIVEDVDLTDEAQAETFFGDLTALWASCNIAGGFAMGPIEKAGLADFRRMIDMNAITCFLACREAIQRVRASGEGGRIVNVSARPALVPSGGMAAYAASKAAVAALSQALAEEVASERIWVNAVAPSIIDTPANREAMSNADHDAWPKPDEIAETIAFLASPQNRSTWGGVIPVYGRA